jgi:hypothetical protein
MPPNKASGFTARELGGSEASVSELSSPTLQRRSAQYGPQIDETMFKYLPADQIPVPKPKELPGHVFTPEMEGTAPVELPVPPPKQDYFMGRH